MRLTRIRSNSEVMEANGKYADAIGHIRSAIDSLGEIANDDSLAFDSIANLSVVLLDLSSTESEDDKE